MSFVLLEYPKLFCAFFGGEGGDIPPSLYVPTHIPDRLSPTGH